MALPLKAPMTLKTNVRVKAGGKQILVGIMEAIVLCDLKNCYDVHKALIFVLQDSLHLAAFQLSGYKNIDI